MQPLMVGFCSRTTSSISFCTQNQATNLHNYSLLPCAGQMFADIWGWQFRNQSGSAIFVSHCIYWRKLHNLILANVLTPPYEREKKILSAFTQWKTKNHQLFLRHYLSKIGEGHELLNLDLNSHWIGIPLTYLISWSPVMTFISLNESTKSRSLICSILSSAANVC